MANTAQARKRARQTVKRRAENASLRSELRSAIKKVRKAIASGNKAAAEEQLKQSQSRIDSIARKQIIHANTAARNKSRLAHAIKAMAAPA